MNAVAVRVVYHFIMKVEPVSFPSKVVFTTKENRIDPPRQKTLAVFIKTWVDSVVCSMCGWIWEKWGWGRRGKWSGDWGQKASIFLRLPHHRQSKLETEHRRTSALLRNVRNIRICMGKKTYRFCNLRKWKDFNKKQLTLLKMCVTSLLCGPRADLWPFYGFLCKRFSLYKVYTF